MTRKDPMKKLIRRLFYNKDKYRLPIPQDLVRSMGWKDKDEIILMPNTDKNRIELYNKSLQLKDYPSDFPVEQLQEIVKKRLLPPNQPKTKSISFKAQGKVITLKSSRRKRLKQYRNLTTLAFLPDFFSKDDFWARLFRSVIRKRQYEKQCEIQELNESIAEGIKERDKLIKEQEEPDRQEAIKKMKPKIIKRKRWNEQIKAKN